MGLSESSDSIKKGILKKKNNSSWRAKPRLCRLVYIEPDDTSLSVPIPVMTYYLIFGKGNQGTYKGCIDLRNATIRKCDDKPHKFTIAAQQYLKNTPPATLNDRILAGHSKVWTFEEASTDECDEWVKTIKEMQTLWGAKLSVAQQRKQPITEHTRWRKTYEGDDRF